MYHQQMEAMNLSDVVGTYAAFAETIQLVVMDGREDFLYRADPILLGLQMAMQSLSATSGRRALGDLLSRLKTGKTGFLDMMKELDSLVFSDIAAPTKPQKTGKRKGKKRGKTKQKKGKKARKIRLALSEGVIKYAESVQVLCHELGADS
ncbi:hypothetical protein PG985_012623 [Apiospora marii]|uniref:uncharacterized protein n=1 Tax=Apiospora marii TaxID=335849 RepID=UPI00312EBDDE